MDPDKFAKVLAMAESEHAGEAASALRAARIMLARDGLSFRDLAASMGTRPPPVSPPLTPTPPDRPPPPDQVMSGLRRQVGDLEREVAMLRRQLDKANTDIDKHRDEADRWRNLARETAEQLWDIGKALERRNIRYSLVERRRAVLEHLQDPGSAMLSNQEIARRVGTSPQLVAHWRRRLAIVGRKARLLPVQPRGRGLWRPNDMRAPGLGLTALDGPRRRWPGLAMGLTIGGAGLRDKPQRTRR